MNLSNSTSETLLRASSTTEPERHESVLQEAVNYQLWGISVRREHLVIALFSLIFLSRLIFLSSDLGLDPDSYRFGINVGQMVQEHRYICSRSPGNPIYEILNAGLLLIGSGWLTNFGTIVASMTGLWFFYRILLHYRIQQPLLLLAIFAFTPAAWINSFVTMDYWWSLALNLAAFYAALKQRYIMAAIITGISVGFRMPAGFMIFPILLLTWQQERDWRTVIKLFPWFVITSVFCYSPMLLSYGINRLDFLPFEHPSIIGIYRAMRFILGVPALILLTIGIVISAVKYYRRHRIPDSQNLAKIAPWLLWLVIMGGLFWKNPADPAYLLPAIPFALLLLGSWLKPGWWIPLLVLVVLNNFISFFSVEADVYKHEDRLLIQPVTHGVLLHHLDDVAHEQQKLLDLQAFKPAVSSTASQPLILVNAFWPRLRYYLRQEISQEQEIGLGPYRSIILKVGDRWYGRDMSLHDLETVKSRNYTIYYTRDADFSTRSTFNYKLEDQSAQALDF